MAQFSHTAICVSIRFWPKGTGASGTTQEAVCMESVYDWWAECAKHCMLKMKHLMNSVWLMNQTCQTLHAKDEALDEQCVTDEPNMSNIAC